MSAGQLQAPSVAQALPRVTNSCLVLFCALSKRLSPAHQLPVKWQLFNKARIPSCEEREAEFGFLLMRCLQYGIIVSLSSKRHCDIGTKRVAASPMLQGCMQQQ